MSVEGQDEREPSMRVADAKRPWREVFAGNSSGDWVRLAEAEAKLDESEARERELEDWKDGQKKALAWAESASEQSRANLRRAEASEAREAVLVEALKAIVGTKNTWGGPPNDRSLILDAESKMRAIALAALAGVVEAGDRQRASVGLPSDGSADGA